MQTVTETTTLEELRRSDYGRLDAGGHVYMTLDDYVAAIGFPSGGAIRASLGLASNTADIERFVAFAGTFVDLADVPDDLPPRVGC